MLRPIILRLFGAKIGSRVQIRAGVRVYSPRMLQVGSNCWIGEGVWFINHAEVKLGSNVCLSQEAVICSSGHDYRTQNLLYKHSAINIGDGSWVCLRAIILPGSELGTNCIISSGEVFSGQLRKDSIYRNGSFRAINYSIEP